YPGRKTGSLRVNTPLAKQGGGLRRECAQIIEFLPNHRPFRPENLDFGRWAARLRAKSAPSGRHILLSSEDFQTWPKRSPSRSSSCPRRIPASITSPRKTRAP